MVLSARNQKRLHDSEILVNASNLLVIESQSENPLVVQWLQFHTFIAKGQGLIPFWGTKILKAVCARPQKRKLAIAYSPPHSIDNQTKIQEMLIGDRFISQLSCELIIWDSPN